MARELTITQLDDAINQPLTNPECGLLATTEESERQFDELMESAVSIRTLGVGDSKDNLATDARILKCDDDFLQALTTLGKYNEALWQPKAGKPTCCSWHWIVAEEDREQQFLQNRLVISQGSVGSCAGHAAHNAVQLSKLTRRAFGIKSNYVSMNRIATWYASKGNSMSGGQILSYMMEYMCYMGLFPESLVGNSISTAPTKYKDYRNEAKEYQSYVVPIPWGTTDSVANIILLAAKAGFNTFVGNTMWPTSKTAQTNGVAKPVFSSGGGHATMVGDWRPATVNKTGFRFQEAVFFGNSHGDKYTAKSESKEPKYGCWLNRDQIKTYLSTAKGFGSPAIFIPEVTLLQDKPLQLDLDILYKYVVPDGLEMVG